MIFFEVELSEDYSGDVYVIASRNGVVKKFHIRQAVLEHFDEASIIYLCDVYLAHLVNKDWTSC